MTGRRGARILTAPRIGLDRLMSMLVVAVVSFGPMCVGPALASAVEDPIASRQIVLTSTMLGLLAVAVASAVGMMRHRVRDEATIRRLSEDNADLRVRADRAEGLLDAEDQLILAWREPGDPPLVLGRLGGEAGAPASRAEFLAFGTWLEPEAAAELDRAVVALRERGTPFDLELGTRSGTHVAAAGRTAGSRPFVRFSDLTGERRRAAELAERHRRLSDEAEVMRALFEAVPMPMWRRGRDGGLAWVNRAYATAVGAGVPDGAVEARLELLDSAGLRAVAQARVAESSTAASLRLPVVVAGRRRTYDVVDVVSPEGEAGVATDVTDLEQTQTELRRTVDFHARTLEQLATAVATFGADKRLMFHNTAFRDLWCLDPAFLESAPDDGIVLDQMRAARRLPEQADWRAWKRDVQSAYRSLESREHWWHLPDGQTLRVIANPHPQGGVTYVYENVTEKIELEKRHKALLRVQGETLDHLSEGVAVFGSDGRLRLSNPAFAALWKLDDKALDGGPHIGDVIERLAILHDDPATWNRLKVAVTGLADNRDRLTGTMERRDGTVLEYAAVPLPDAATLVTFVNVTDTVNVERALVEKNEALEKADHIKTDFVGLVSYELRSPLTNIIGFAHLLADSRTGPLNDKQRDYTGHIVESSQALTAIVDDILDLATIDAGIMRLQVGDIDVAMTVAAAVEGIKDRLAAHDLHLVTEIDPAVGSFAADEKRVRQILFNLLSNAISFSLEGGTIVVMARRESGRIVIAVGDEGVGIPEEDLRQVFERFYSRPKGPHRGGAGLGLSIVKSFVELHGGSIEIRSTEGRGTTVVCRFPVAAVIPRDLDETDDTTETRSATGA